MKFELNEVMGQWKLQGRTRNWDDRGDKTLVYVDMGDQRPMRPEPPPSLKGTDKDIDKAWKIYNRLEVDGMREVIEATLGVDVAQQLKFSKYAGCKCGCSPGFVGQSGLVFDDHGVALRSIWISPNEDVVEFVGEQAWL